MNFVVEKEVIGTRFNRIFTQRDSVISPLEFKIIADEMYGNLTDNEISYMFKVIDKIIIISLAK